MTSARIGPRSTRRMLGTLLLCAALVPALAAAYEPDVHQRLTFHAAKALNRCVAGTAVAPLTPLQVRFIATSNIGLANSNAMARFFRWSYYDAAGQDDRRLLWVINTRFHDHFDELVEVLHGTADANERFRELGRIVSYIQLVSAPSRVVPVYTARFWRWSFGDRFDSYPLNEAALEAALASDCGFLRTPPRSYRAVLDEVAEHTLSAVLEPIEGLPTTWESFWEPGKSPGEFGDYGRAGNNFGRRVEFPCSARGHEVCVLLNDDPLYARFALTRQLSAVRGTARAMYLHQLEHGPRGDAMHAE